MTILRANHGTRHPSVKEYESAGKIAPLVRRRRANPLHSSGVESKTRRASTQHTSSGPTLPRKRAALHTDPRWNSAQPAVNLRPNNPCLMNRGTTMASSRRKPKAKCPTSPHRHDAPRWPAREREQARHPKGSQHTFKLTKEESNMTPRRRKPGINHSRSATEAWRTTSSPQQHAAPAGSAQ